MSLTSKKLLGKDKNKNKTFRFCYRCLQQRSAYPRDKGLYQDKYDYVGYMHDHTLGGGRECEYSHVWEIQTSPYTGITSIKDTDIASPTAVGSSFHRDHPSNKYRDAKNLPASPKRELPAVPAVGGATAVGTGCGTALPPGGKTERIYERSHPGSTTGSSSGYSSSRPGGPVYFELEQQQQQQQQQQQCAQSQNSYSA